MITAVVLTKNTAFSLEKTLGSVSWCDEIICIDDFSTDNTVKIAKDYGAAVYKRHLDGDFSIQRNFGLEKAKGEWVLFVDSDEIVPEALQQEIRETISRQGTARKGSVGYFLRREDIFFGKKLIYGETAHVKLLRLAQRKAGRWIRPVHELWDVKGPTQTLVNSLLHYPHTDVAQFVKDINKYTSINAEYLLKQGERSNLFVIIAYPLGKFFRNYLFRFGFLDGTSGCIMAIMMSFHSFLTRSKLYMAGNRRK